MRCLSECEKGLRVTGRKRQRCCDTMRKDGLSEFMCDTPRIIQCVEAGLFRKGIAFKPIEKICAKGCAHVILRIMNMTVDEPWKNQMRGVLDGPTK